MPLLTDDIDAILSSNGKVKFNSLVSGEGIIDTHTGDAIFKNCYNKQILTASRAENTITMTRVAMDATNNNCIDIRTIDSVAAIGAVGTPGYVYTGNFSGCVFYLYKTGAKEVTGVHAYSGMKTVTTQKSFLFIKWKKITTQVQESSPQDFYLRNPGQLICRHPTRGELKTGAFTGDPAAETSLAFLSCVEATSATTFLFSVKASMSAPEFTVRRLLAKYVDAY